MLTDHGGLAQSKLVASESSRPRLQIGILVSARDSMHGIRQVGWVISSLLGNKLTVAARYRPRESAQYWLK